MTNHVFIVFFLYEVTKIAAAQLPPGSWFLF